MSTVALKRRTFVESRNRVSLGGKIAGFFRAVYAEYAPEMICGMLAMTGDTNSFRVYRMLKK